MRVELWRQIQASYGELNSVRAGARRLGLHRKTVREALRWWASTRASSPLGRCAERARPSRSGAGSCLTSYSNLVPDAGPRIADTSVELAQRLTPDAVPQRPQVEVSTTPWSYGRLGPELE